MNEPIGNENDSTTQMSHEEAVEMEAVAQYLLNDLNPDDRHRFEEHYFECDACAKAVGAGQVFVHGIRPLPEPWWRRLAFPILTPATVALATLLAIQNVSTIPSLKTQLAGLDSLQANTVIMATPAERGAPDGEAVSTSSVSIEFNLPPDAASPFYRIEIKGEKTSMSQVIPAPTGSRVSLHMTRQLLGTGSFNVAVYGLATSGSGDGAQLGRYDFRIQ